MQIAKKKGGGGANLAMNLHDFGDGGQNIGWGVAGGEMCEISRSMPGLFSSSSKATLGSAVVEVGGAAGWTGPVTWLPPGRSWISFRLMGEG